MEIKVNGLDNPQVISLLNQHQQDMLLHSPPESVHAFDCQALQAEEVTFWTIWLAGELAGCGALKKLDNKHAEIKAMRTSPAFLRKGVARQLLSHIIDQAKLDGYQQLSLETGTKDVFIPAQKLYQTFGFQPCLPFAGYQEDPYSTFMTKFIG